MLCVFEAFHLESLNITIHFCECTLFVIVNRPLMASSNACVHILMYTLCINCRV